MFSVPPITIAFWVEPEYGFWVKIVGNKIHWNEVYINDANADKEIVAEMLKAAYDDEGRFLLQKISRQEAEDFIRGHHHSSDEAAYLISCGSL
jgi:hypothetical protein